MRGSDVDSVDMTVVTLDGEAPVVTLDGVSKRYEAVRITRARRLFSVFGGLEGDAVIEDDDDDDDDDGGVDDEQAEDEVVVGQGLALDDVHVELRGAGGIGVIGARPEGRSALMRLVAGLAAPDHGRVIVEGKVVPLFDSLLPLLPRQGKVGRLLPVAADFLGLHGHEVSRRLPEILDFAGDGASPKTSLAGVPTKRRQALLFTALLALEPDIVLVDTRAPRTILGGRLCDRLVSLKRAGCLVIAAGSRPEDVDWIADTVVEVEAGRVDRLPVRPAE
jgi:ABC-2 type transport system ATP-binding protein